MCRCRVRQLHFDVSDIIMDYRGVIQGEELQMSRANWMLSKVAVLHLFPNLSAYLYKPKKQALCTTKTQITSQVSPCISNVPVQVTSNVQAPVEGAISGNVTSIMSNNVAGCAGSRYHSNMF